MKPRIGITLATPKEGKTLEDVIAANARYLRAVEEAGGTAEAIIAPWPADDPTAAALIARLDGLILSGGGDIHPRYYTQPGSAEYQTATAGWLYPDEPRDEIELRILRHYLPTQKPVLAICRGFQVLNVALGGRLIPDLPAREHNTRRDGTSGYHGVTVVCESRLGRALLSAEGGGETGVNRDEQDRQDKNQRENILNILSIPVQNVSKRPEIEIRRDCATSLYVNSRHHQGVGREMLAPGLKPTATSDVGDLLIEGYETPHDRYLIGVQWHPERILDFGDREQAASRAIFRAFVAAALTLLSPRGVRGSDRRACGGHPD